jgi:hypothetical protein
MLKLYKVIVILEQTTDQTKRTEAAEMSFMRWAVCYILSDGNQVKKSEANLKLHSIRERTKLYRRG